MRLSTIGSAALVTAGLLACQDAALRSCRELAEQEDHAAAAERCAAVFERTGDARAGLLAARAELAAGRQDAALAWAERLVDSDAEAAAWRLAAGVHRRRGEGASAQRAYRRELELRRAAGDAAAEAECLYGLFFLAWRASEHRRALELAGESLAAAERAHDREAEGKAYEALYTVLYEVGDLANAERALKAAHELRPPADEGARARFLLNRGLLQLDRRRPRLARHDFERALELAPAVDVPRFDRSLRANLVQASLELDDLAAAERHLAALAEHDDGQGVTRLYFAARVAQARGRHEQAAALYADALAVASGPDWRWLLELHRGQAEEAAGAVAAARHSYQNAAGALEAMRADLALDELKSALLDARREPFEALFRLAVGGGRPEEVLGAVERAKSRAFLDAFITATAPPPATRSPATWSAAGQRLETLAALLPAVSASPVVAPRPAGELLAAVGRRRVLAYFRAGDELWLIAVGEGRVRPHRLAPSAAEIGRRVDRLLARLDERAAAAELGEVLLPAGVLPAAGEPLHVVTDGDLGRLPFAALVRRGRFLVEDHAVVYLPSVSALAVLGERRGGEPGEPVVLGDPRGDLPGAAREAAAVAAALGTVALTGGDATLEALRQAARARVLHLATHTGLGPRGPWLALADGDAGTAEVLAGPLAPRLVVLAGCASAARRGEGLWGSLGAAFLAAGSQAVLASLSSIDDDAARRFVERFYREGGAGDPAGALARAQRALIAGGAPPADWAPFVLLGAADPLSPIQDP
jgi:tetratricopeptide (TPR) repeat protein